MSARIRVTAGLIGGALVVASCVLEAQTKRPTAEVSAISGTDGVRAGRVAALALRVALPEGFHVQSNAPREPTLIPTVLTVDAPAGVTVEEIVYPPTTDLEQAGQKQPLAVFEREFAIGVVVRVPANASGEIVLPARLRYQTCNAQLCFAPTTASTQWTLRVVPAGVAIADQNRDVFKGIAFGKGIKPPAPTAVPANTPVAAAAAPRGLAALDTFTELASTGGYQGTSEFLKWIHDAETGVKRGSLFEGRGPLAILLLVLVGGLALNLTPCVLPMIPINLAIIGAGAQAGSRGRGFLLGSAYGGAMAVVYGVLGLVVILTAGTFGTINASPWFNAGITVLFVVLGLAMFDLLLIDFSRFSTMFQPSAASRGSVGLAFAMGAVAALLAGACVAPVVIQVVLFSSGLYATGTRVALALPFVLGIGMAIPWPLAGAGMAALPKPGAWMVRVKQAFGVVILGTAVYYGHLAYTLFADRWVDPTAVTSSVNEKVKAGWHASLDEGLAAARREQKPVLIDLWATWCKNCLAMDKTTFEDETVRQALSGYVKIKVQAEDPDDPNTKAIMQRFKAVGLPTYAILRPKPRLDGYTSQD
jgi:thioredoxin:protein disulfide reductase